MRKIVLGMAAHAGTDSERRIQAAESLAAPGRAMLAQNANINRSELAARRTLEAG